MELAILLKVRGSYIDVHSFHEYDLASNRWTSVQFNLVSFNIVRVKLQSQWKHVISLDFQIDIIYWNL